MNDINLDGPYAGQYGAFPGITREIYQLKMNQFSQSWSAYFDPEPEGQKTPKNFYHEYLDPKGPGRVTSDALLFGDAFHTIILEPEEFKRRAIWWEDTKTTDSKAYQERLKTLEYGQMLLLVKWKDQLQGMFDSMMSNRDIMDILNMPGENELTLIFKEPVTGVDCKARLDRCIRDFGLMPDLKTARDASKSGFRKAVREHNYHVQNAVYEMAYTAVYGEKPAAMPFIVCEKEPPYLTAVYYLDDQDIQHGQYLFNNRIERYAECLKRKYWPGYQEKPQKLALEEWYRRKIENGEL